MSKLKLNIVIVGAGNVAWHLAKELQKKEQKIIQVYNRSVEPAISLSQRLKCDFTTRIEDINQKADRQEYFYFLKRIQKLIIQITKNINKDMFKTITISIIDAINLRNNCLSNFVNSMSIILIKLKYN